MIEGLPYTYADWVADLQGAIDSLKARNAELEGRLRAACEPCAECGHIDYRELDDILPVATDEAFRRRFWVLGMERPDMFRDLIADFLERLAVQPVAEEAGKQPDRGTASDAP